MLYRPELVPGEGDLWTTGRVVQPAPAERSAQCGEQVWWIDQNILGVHLPQMHRESELVVIEKPSDVAQENRKLCVLCMGYGLTNKAMDPPDVPESPCSYCEGSGRIDIKVHVTEPQPGVIESRIVPNPPAEETERFLRGE
jgi:hypothetical protein